MHPRTGIRPRVLAALIAVLALVAGACAPQEEEAPPTAEETPEEETSPTPDEEEDESAAAGDPFADLKEAAGHVGEQGSAKALATGIVAATGMEGDVESAASQTYATLSTLLEEHVYLAGTAVDVGLSFGLDSPEFEAAAATLDENSVELADVVGSVSDEEKRDQFLELWRTHIGFFVDYAEGAAGGDEAAKEQARSDLDGYRSQAGAFFEEISGGEIPASAVEESLKGHIETLTQAIDAAAADDTAVFSHLKEAAGHVGEQGSAKALATGIAAAATMDGDVESPASQTYATLSTVLQEHVYLAGLAVYTGYNDGLDSPAFEAAAATLDENSVELADIVGSVSDQEKRDQFLELWRTHIGFFVAYAEGAAAGDEAAMEQARSDLDGYRSQAGAFFEEISGGEIAASDVEESLKGHIETLTQAIDSLAGALVESAESAES